VAMAKFFWGDEAFSMKLLPGCILLGAFLTAACISLPTPSGPSLTAKSPVAATLLWSIGYYQLIGAQVLVKQNPSKTAQASTVAERSFMNTMEQGIPFLVLMWLHAGLVDGSIAGWLGISYAGVRMLYGVAYSYYGEFSMLCELVTQPNYQVIFFYQVSLLCWLFDTSLLDTVGQGYLTWAGLTFIGSFVNMFVLWMLPFGMLSAKLNLATNSAEAWTGPSNSEPLLVEENATVYVEKV